MFIVRSKIAADQFVPDWRESRFNLDDFVRRDRISRTPQRRHQIRPCLGRFIIGLVGVKVHDAATQMGIFDTGFFPQCP